MSEMNEPPDADRDTGSQVVVAPGVRLSEGALRFTFSRSGGPGGQHVNKVATRATLMVHLADLEPVMPADALRRLRERAGQRLARDPDRLVLSAAESRSQRGNRQACLRKLRQLLIEAMHRPRPRRPTRPTRGSKERRLQAKQARGQRKAARRDDRRPKWNE